MHYFRFEETVDAAFEKKPRLLETARCAGAYMKSCGLHISRGYNEILQAESLGEIGQAVINHCSYYKVPREFLKDLK